MSRAFDRNDFDDEAFDVELWDIVTAQSEIWTVEPAPADRIPVTRPIEP